MARPLTDSERDALRNVVDYCWQDEQRDYNEQDESGQAFHIFGDLGALQAFLDDTAADRG